MTEFDRLHLAEREEALENTRKQQHNFNCTIEGRPISERQPYSCKAFMEFTTYVEDHLLGKPPPKAATGAPA